MRNSSLPELMIRWAGYQVMALLLVAVAAFVCPASAGETTKAADQSDEQKGVEQGKSEHFVYQYENRKDPFMPFIGENTAALADDEIIENGEPLTGMQLFEPGQLTLVGLVNKGGEYYALVEDSTGKGYILTKGMKIGRRGLVREIGPNKVFIDETAITRTGKTLVTPVNMALKKEAEK
ncbi:MAG: pilus assembly protein PilP [Desulfobulbaceae bacterium]|jgi:type IV pilus assembly protein PilP|nr:pilus assembly protein PilP [Desulfobulbaceae bacterium]